MRNLKHLTIDCRMYGKNFGGIGRYVQEIVQHLIQKNTFLITILGNDEACEELKQYQENYKINIIPCSSTMFTLAEQIELKNKIPVCDVFWSPFINVPFFPIKADRRVVTIHDVFHIANPEYYSFLKRKLISVYYYFSTKLSSKIITVSNFSKKEIGKYFGEKIENRTIVIHNGCDINPESVIKEKTFGNYILFVGSVKPHKNLRKALHAFDKLDDPNLKFVIVGKKEGFITGDDSVFKIVEEINNKSNKIIFTGKITDYDLYAYYKNAKMLIMPSLYEGFGLPIIEAMKFDIPIACSDLEVFHEIGNDQLFYFDPNDESAIKTAMQKALMVDKVHYENGIFSWEDVSQKVKDVLQNEIL